MQEPERPSSAAIGGSPRRMSALFGLAEEAYSEWRRDRAIRLGAGLAYYGLFTIVPLASIAIFIASLLFTNQQIAAYLVDRLGPLVGADVRQLAAELAADMDSPDTKTGLGVIGIGSWTFAASVAFVALQDTFNVIWHRPVGRGLAYTLRRRLVALLVVLLAGALLVASLLIQSVTSLVVGVLPSQPSWLQAVDNVTVTAATWGLGVGVIVLLFRLLVPVSLRWWNLIWVSTLTAIFLVASTGVFTIYSRFSSVSLTGAAGAVLLVLIWLYFEAQVVVAAAELLKVANRSGDRSGVTHSGSRPAAE